MIIFQKVEVFPHYNTGFVFRWEVNPVFVDPIPWTFVVERAPAKDGPWTAAGPAVVNKFIWTSDCRIQINKDEVLFFRISLTTSKGVYHSQVVKPYGDLPKREFLIARELMRKEILQARTMAGVIGQLWSISTFGERCKHCRDPITNDVLDSNCSYCLGTGRLPPYHGPYNTWMTFSPSARDEQMADDGSGTRQPYTFEVRMICCPYAKDSDVIVDPCKDKRYYVDAVKSEAEIRRIAIVQTLTVHEAPVSEAIYNLKASDV